MSLCDITFLRITKQILYQNRLHGKPEQNPAASDQEKHAAWLDRFFFSLDIVIFNKKLVQC